MSATTAANWAEANWQHLTNALETVRYALLRHTRKYDIPESAGSPAAGMELSPPPALETVVKLFGLSAFERAVLLLCAGCELDSRFATLCATIHGDPHQSYPTFSVALAALPDPQWSAVTPAAPLRDWQLIHVEPGASLTRNTLRIDERILHYLAGVSHLDAQLAGLVQPQVPPEKLAPSHWALAREIAATWSQAAGQGALPAMQLCGPEVAGKRDIAAAACRLLGLPLYRMPAAALPTRPGEHDQMLRLWQREYLLDNHVLLLDCDDSDPHDKALESAIAQIVEATPYMPLLLTGRERRGPWQRPVLTFDVVKPTPAEQRQVWVALLGQDAELLAPQVEQIVSQFNLDAPAIAAAHSGALGLMEDAIRSGDRPAEEKLGDALWQVCRRQARPRLDDLAARIDTVAGWDDLVLPDAELEILHEIAAQVRGRSQVYERWGFQAKSRRGLGISALFAGASGTGKTLAAEVLANELRLDLYRIDLSAIVSKWVGETEKNLSRVFDAAEAGGAILLFDEADALFGKRGEVKDSHDRYANIEISYLLQRMESYRGLAILTSNLKESLDSAFARRIRFTVTFPFPDAAERAAIWQRVFPAATPTKGLDPTKLARLDLPGGSIRNIALNAAFLAAGAGEPVRMAHLLRAARREYAKLERPINAADVKDWL